MSSFPQLPYADRPITYRGTHTIYGWKFKMYNIYHESNSPAEEEEWTEILRLLEQHIPSDRQYDREWKLGFLIYHKGYDSNYFVINWWSEVNMLRTFAWRSPRDAPDRFQFVDDGLNVCVWDMEIQSFERDLFIKHILNYPDSPEIDLYLKGHLQK